MMRMLMIALVVTACGHPGANHLGDANTRDDSGLIHDGDGGHGGDAAIDPCSGSDSSTCATPPATECVGGNVRSYDAAGTCSAGTCSYEHHDTACAAGCFDATCTPTCTTTGTWTDYVITAGGATVGHDGAALTPDGTVYVPYQDYATTGLGLAHRAPGVATFTLAVIDAQPASHWNGNVPAIASDHGGGLHVAHYDSREDTLRFAELAPTPGAVWSSGRIGVPGNGGTRPSIAIDSADGVHVMFTDAALNLQYAYHPANANGAWTVTPVGLTGDHPMLAAAPDGSLHVVYASGGNINYAWRSANATTFTYVTSFSGGAYAGIAVDVQGNLHVVTADAGLRYFFLPHGSTVFAQTVFDDETAQQPTIAVEPSGAVHIGYIAGIAGSTEYIHYAYKPPGGAFTTELVSDLGEADLQAAITVDVHGGVHITHENYHFDNDTSYVQDAFLDRSCVP